MVVLMQFFTIDHFLDNNWLQKTLFNRRKQFKKARFYDTQSYPFVLAKRQRHA